MNGVSHNNRTKLAPTHTRSPAVRHRTVATSSPFPDGRCCISFWDSNTPSDLPVQHPIRCRWCHFERQSSWWEADLFFLDHGTPKGLPGGPEKPAASDYYSSQPGAERESGRASVEPPPLSDRLSSSSPSHKHWFPSTQHATQTHRNLCFVPLLLTVKRFLFCFLPEGLTFFSNNKDSAFLTQSCFLTLLLHCLSRPRPAVTVRPPSVDYAPFFQLREGALRCSGSHQETAWAEIKEEWVW